jgi:glycine/serine hydroxymethyltransferase
MHLIGDWIGAILKDIHNERSIEKIGDEVKTMVAKFPLYPD